MKMGAERERERVDERLEPVERKGKMKEREGGGKTARKMDREMGRAEGV